MAVEDSVPGAAAGPLSLSASGEWWAGYVGLPFDANGLDRTGVSCWGLVRMILAEQQRIALPAFDTLDARDLIRVAETMDANMGPWRQVERPREFDGVRMWGTVKVGGRERSMPCHVGIMIDEKRMIHVERATSALVVPIKHPLIVGRVIGFFRHESLA